MRVFVLSFLHKGQLTWQSSAHLANYRKLQNLLLVERTIHFASMSSLSQLKKSLIPLLAEALLRLTRSCSLSNTKTLLWLLEVCHAFSL
ncbi:hypothetical protein GYH30_016072 [Glycine max]|uniref:Uncharacterized protein n=1 Tax=Glycine max TaxID=3847 RepID=A0A0R0JKZ4_SOYBN|nr:hypothetical protein GYH30_016072 [Glycine max]